MAVSARPRLADTSIDTCIGAITVSSKEARNMSEQQQDPRWMTTAQAAGYVSHVVSQQAIKVAAQRDHETRYVRKVGREWQVSTAWPRLQRWRARADDAAAGAQQRQRIEELEALVARQQQRIKELEEQALAATAESGEPATDDAQDPAQKKDEPSVALANDPGDVLHDDAALRALWIREGKPSRRTFAEMVGMSKSWVSEHLRKAGAEQG